MSRIFCITLLYLYYSLSVFAQETVNIKNIEIVRDAYGVPHIFSQTDVEAVYGLAWAQCEDNFNIMQDDIAASVGRSGRLMGKGGALLDFIYQVFKIEEFVEERYKQDIDAQMEDMLEAYCAAVNKYAATHPKEVKSSKIFPLTPKRVLGTHTLHLLLLHNSVMELGKLMDDEFDYVLLDKQAGRGSNAMAFAPHFTTDGKSYLIGNPHQPVNNIGNFWEVSVHSAEGYEMYGATFSVGGMFPALGSNRHLGWTHTTNYHNTVDVYRLEMHPNNKNQYKYDGEWRTLEAYKAKLKVKLGLITIPISKQYYWSVHGPVFKKESGYYAFKTNAFHNLKTPEQWYKMGKATNFDEFKAALDVQGLSGQTITYADRDGNIYHLSNFVHPNRDEAFDWSGILDGTTSSNNWNLDEIHAVKDLPQIKNPIAGYVYNCNNTVFRMTAPEENPQPEEFPKSFGLLTSNTLRANTFEKLIKNYDKISYEEARKIREDITIDKEKMSFRNVMNGDDIPQIIAAHPELASYKAVYDKWNGSFDIKNKQASLMVLTAYYFAVYIKSQFGNVEKEMPEEEIVKAMLLAEKFLLKHYGTLEVALGHVQKAVRHDVEMPMYGSLNTLANCSIVPHQKGTFKITAGDSYIFYAKYGKDGLEEMQTINAFGNSMKPQSPHHTDQTEMYVKQETKEVVLDVEKLRANFKGYHPQ